MQLNYDRVRIFPTDHKEGMSVMGEVSMFTEGNKAPKAGVYIEDGENGNHDGVKDPQMVQLTKGERFPKNTNHNRKWKYLK